MSNYRLIEKSVYGGKPIECYWFHNSTNDYRYTSADEDIILGGETYEAIPITRGNLESNPEIHASELKINLPKDNTFAISHMNGEIDDYIFVTIYRFHSDSPTDYYTYWKGRTIGVNMSFPNSQFSINCESIFSSLKRNGLKLRFSRLCNATLYQDRCGVDKSSYEFEGDILQISTDGTNLFVDGAVDEDLYYFLGGYLSYAGSLRHIVKHVDNLIVISRKIVGLEVLNTVKMYPGCDKNINTCINKFNNLENFRGCPYIPVRNPFDGRSII